MTFRACLLILLIGTLSLWAEMTARPPRVIDNWMSLPLGPGGNVTVLGQSLLDKSQNQAVALDTTTLKSAWLIWQTNGKASQLNLMIDGKSNVITHQHEKLSRDVRVRLTEVTKHLNKSNVKNVTSMLVTKDKRTVAGWSLILIPKGDESISSLTFGASRLRPGESYQLKLSGNPKQTSRVTVIGGGGLKGNGSVNMLNGQALSAGDDWNGSAGKNWDIDSYPTTDKKFAVGQDNQLIMSTSLQWLFPCMVLTELKSD